jgi:hypothetical protein
MRPLRRSWLGFAALATALPIALAGCASDDIAVSTTFDPLVRFPATATYAWDDAARSLPEDPRIDARSFDTLVKQAADQEFAARGYRAVASGPANFRLSYQFVVHTWIGADNSRAVGSLSLLLAESRSRRRVWLGFGKAEIHVGLSEAERRERLRDAFARMLKDFPPSQRGD